MRDDMKYIRSGEVSALLCDLCGRTATGMLRLESPGGIWEAGIENGRLNVLSMPDAYINPLLGDLLAEAGIINKAVLFELLQESQKRGRLCGRVLMDHGVSQQVLWDILKTQARQRFFRFVRFACGSFQFIPDIKPDGKNSLGRPLDPVEECRRMYFDDIRIKTKIKTLQNSLDDFIIQTSGDCVPHHLLRFTWEHKAIEELHRNGAQKASQLLKKAPTRLVGGALLLFLKEMGAIDVMNYPDKGFFFFDTGQNSPSKREWKSKVKPAWSFSAEDMGSKNPYNFHQPYSNAGAEAKSREISHTTNSKKSFSIHHDKKDFEKTLKKWWRSMARRYHPDIHQDADPKVRRLYAQRFVAARETYLKCLKEMGPSGMSVI